MIPIDINHRRGKEPGQQKPQKPKKRLTKPSKAVAKTTQTKIQKRFAPTTKSSSMKENYENSAKNIQ